MDPDFTASGDNLHLRLGCQFEYLVQSEAEFIVLVAPPTRGHSATCLLAGRRIEPDTGLHEFVDGYGNTCWRFTSHGPRLTVRYDAVFAVLNLIDGSDWSAPQNPVSALPDDVLVYILPSRYCPADLLTTQSQRLVADVPPGYPQVHAICDWIHANIQYAAGASSPSTSALDTYTSRRGVCRDFAHLAVTLCRALSIPARYVCGYLPDYGVASPDVPMDFHAWFEAFLGGRWYTFDARHNTPRIGRVKIAHGRDAVDVAMVTSYGDATLMAMAVWTDIIPTRDSSLTPMDLSGAGVEGHGEPFPVALWPPTPE
jgi:transglutaminase-like putative cysteine protease